MNRLLPILIIGLASIPSTGYAAARCDGDFPARGSGVSPRYCRALQIAKVAHESGIDVSAETLLRHPSRADEICRFVGSDIRVQPACQEIYAIFGWSW
jgi:hypothetical protein